MGQKKRLLHRFDSWKGLERNALLVAIVHPARKLGAGKSLQGLQPSRMGLSICAWLLFLWRDPHAVRWSVGIGLELKILYKSFISC